MTQFWKDNKDDLAVMATLVLMTWFIALAGRGV